MSDSSRAINMVIAALGGEGGGVLTNWLIAVADQEGWLCQTTSLAGVAQRTGATIYYLEFIPRPEDGSQPVLSLFPSQGDIDIAVASEIAEAGRMLSRGFVSPEQTTLIASTHRVYGITEKSATGDGTIDPAMLSEMCARYARRFIQFDMLELVGRHNTVVSAALFGAIAGSEVLPFARETFERIIGEGRGADANRAAFNEAWDRAQSGGVGLFDPNDKGDSSGFVLPDAHTAQGRVLIERMRALPVMCHEVVYRGASRLIDYQDLAYAEDYLFLVEKLATALDSAGSVALTEAARYLALWMAFEDIPRVAQLKVRPDRQQAIRDEVRAEPEQPIRVTEFFHPRVEEIAAMLPKRFGERLLASETARSGLGRLLGPRKLRTDRLSVYLIMRVLARLRRFRRGTLGYAEERGMIDRWFGAVLWASARDPELALELAECGRMVKGYGATRARTTSRLMRILDTVDREAEVSPARIRQLREAAMEGEDSAPFEGALNQALA
ncbi:indolepyruvate ferredoxin oxidoreductase beta subunit [Luminiphilus syltensis NOR5-1B]|uniref:Indolepyruvate ferredoxin oxidoreductase beta subunit n=1 Tax=Luminiphilus syltensis NOR5-1B TaxID=565045 RepID=B8KTA6_9GAMM|nr:indolepyruvate oxidoreductase subunit beta family protein [Luminiphilus syltensis]EED35428.1 indolepyruvate ferredoxin oxidoreductase beta subunit [Luminiphilus syltensis NOR5-1B]